MAADNKTLGRFQLGDIPPAPRGVPQIEVKFDIDANGIFNVSAKDLGTGKTQNITIQSGSGLSDAEIEKMVKEAEENAEADNKRKEKADTLNDANNLIFQVEKALRDLGDKATPEEKAECEEGIKELKEALDKDDIDLIKEKKEALEKKAQNVAIKAYQQNQGAQNASDAQDEPKTNDDGTVDAEFKDIN